MLTFRDHVSNKSNILKEAFDPDLEDARRDHYKNTIRNLGKIAKKREFGRWGKALSNLAKTGNGEPALSAANVIKLAKVQSQLENGKLSVVHRAIVHHAHKYGTEGMTPSDKTEIEKTYIHKMVQKHLKKFPKRGGVPKRSGPAIKTSDIKDWKKYIPRISRLITGKISTKKPAVSTKKTIKECLDEMDLMMKSKSLFDYLNEATNADLSEFKEKNFNEFKKMGQDKIANELKTWHSSLSHVSQGDGEHALSARYAVSRFRRGDLNDVHGAIVDHFDKYGTRGMTPKHMQAISTTLITQSHNDFKSTNPNTKRKVRRTDVPRLHPSNWPIGGNKTVKEEMGAGAIASGPVKGNTTDSVEIYDKPLGKKKKPDVVRRKPVDAVLLGKFR